MRKGVRISTITPPPPSSESNGRLLITRVMYFVFTVRHDRLYMSVPFLFKAKLYIYRSSAAGEEGVPPPLDTNVTPGFRLKIITCHNIWASLYSCRFVLLVCFYYIFAGQFNRTDQPPLPLPLKNSGSMNEIFSTKLQTPFPVQIVRMHRFFVVGCLLYRYSHLNYLLLYKITGHMPIMDICWLAQQFLVFHGSWVELNWLFNVTINDISVIYVTAHRCAGGLKKKLDLRSGSQRHRHFVGFFNVPVLAPTRDHPFYTVIPTHRPI